MGQKQTARVAGRRKSDGGLQCNPRFRSESSRNETKQKRLRDFPPLSIKLTCRELKNLETSLPFPRCLPNTYPEQSLQKEETQVIRTLTWKAHPSPSFFVVSRACTKLSPTPKKPVLLSRSQRHTLGSQTYKVIQKGCLTRVDGGTERYAALVSARARQCSSSH